MPSRWGVLGALLLTGVVVRQGGALTRALPDRPATLMTGPVASMAYTSLAAPGDSAGVIRRVAVEVAALILFGKSDFVLEPQLLYATRGAQTVAVRPAYPDLPVQVRAYLEPQTDFMRLYMLAGGYVALLTSCMIAAMSRGTSTECGSVDVVAHTIDMGASLGSGLDIAVGAATWRWRRAGVGFCGRRPEIQHAQQRLHPWGRVPGRD